MTDPLIDREELAALVFRTAMTPDLEVSFHWRTVDAVLAYLRKVLTPEALELELIRTSACGADGADLHRRIFGEEPAPPEAPKPSRVMWGTRGSASS